MVQKYQNEIAPIFYYEISSKTNEKDLKIPNLQTEKILTECSCICGQNIMNPSQNQCQNFGILQNSHRIIE